MLHWSQEVVAYHQSLLAFSREAVASLLNGALSLAGPSNNAKSARSCIPLPMGEELLLSRLVSLGLVQPCKFLQLILRLCSILSAFAASSEEVFRSHCCYLTYFDYFYDLWIVIVY